MASEHETFSGGSSVLERPTAASPIKPLFLELPLGPGDETSSPASSAPTPQEGSRPGAAGIADNRGKRIAVLIVAYNAVTTLVSVLKRIPAEVWENVEEVAVFDDASKDDTHALAVGYKTLTGVQKLTTLRNAKNLGYGGNQKLGYQHFMDKGFDVVILLHGDGQYAPEILANMYAPLVAGEAEAVFGSRMMPDFGGPRKGGMPLYKLLGNRVLTTFENRALGMTLTEFHSGYRAYRLDALRKIDLSKMTNDFHFDTEIIIKLNHQGMRIKEIPIPTYYGNEICHVNGMKYAKDVFKAVLRYKRTVRAVATYPEYSEYAVHYPLKESRFSSHDYFRRFAGAGHEVLDVGCGEGYFARELSEANNKVVGVDLLAAPKCAEALDQYHQADLDSGLGEPVKAALNGRQFDRVLLQDVLEHLRFPERLLADCRPLVRPSGLLLVSVPNVANITVRLSLLLGRFNYQQRGILDKTHVRFFTRRTARKLISDNGYEVVKEKNTVMPVELAVGIPAKNPLMRLANLLLFLLTLLMPGLFGYQCVFVARPAGGKGQ
jgi:2-polyprenyl-3-methyl-5-hydroxy-6-metoxy-1,4-benzoquinol methylase